MNHNTLEQLSAIKQACLLTVGEMDIFTPLRFSLEMASRLPHAQLEVFKNGGHCHHWEYLSDFNTMTLEFLLTH
jgi:pimeloyl-ACP methyl ester carboxylesterase